VGKKKSKGSLKAERANTEPKQPKKQADQQPKKQSKKPPDKGPNKGRVVITHSTYIPGLIDLLEKLAIHPEIQTITPAVISRAKANSPQFRLKVSVPITGGHKLIARKSKSAQEVFVITQWTKAELEGAIAQALR
jgi:hypothetical protein